MVYGEFIAERVYMFFKQLGYHVDISHNGNKFFLSGVSFEFKTSGKSLDVLIVPGQEAESFGKKILEANNPGFYREFSRLRERQKKSRRYLSSRRFEIDGDGSYHFRAEFNPEGKDITYGDRLSVGIIDYVVRPAMIVQRESAEKSSDSK